MKIETFFYAGIGVFFALLAAVYWFASYDAAGTALLIFGTGMAGIIASFTFLQGRRMPARPEDLGDAEIEEGAGEIGFFSPHSWWPLPTAFFACVAALGIVYPWWLMAVGGAGLAISLGGFLFEDYVS